MSLTKPVRVHNLRVSYGDRPVLTGVDFNVEENDFIGLIGPNGAGKTTLLRSILGLVPSTAGSIEIFGRPPRSAREFLGYVPQRHEFAWDFPISVEAAVLNGRIRSIGLLRRARPQDRSCVAEAIDQVGLGALRKRPIGQLSGGQRQRVLVARALAMRPKLLFLDEPFTGLDAPTQKVLNEVIRNFASQPGQAVVLTTHDLPAAAIAATRLCLINRRVIADAAPGQLLNSAVWQETFGMPSTDQLAAALGATRG